MLKEMTSQPNGVLVEVKEFWEDTDGCWFMFYTLPQAQNSYRRHKILLDNYLYPSIAIAMDEYNRAYNGDLRDIIVIREIMKAIPESRVIQTPKPSLIMHPGGSNDSKQRIAAEQLDYLVLLIKDKPLE
jgi:hypothetical protein